MAILISRQVGKCRACDGMEYNLTVELIEVLLCRDRAIRFVKATWPNDTAYFDLQSAFSSQNTDRDMKGTIKIEIPLATRHIGNIEYGLKERQLLATGHCVIDYNAKKVLNGQYTCKSETRAGFAKDQVKILLENDMKPIGINYEHAVGQKGVDGDTYVSIKILLKIRYFYLTNKFKLSAFSLKTLLTTV